MRRLENMSVRAERARLSLGALRSPHVATTKLFRYPQGKPGSMRVAVFSDEAVDVWVLETLFIEPTEEIPRGE